MEGRPLDPVAVREAREYVAHWLTLPTMTPEERDALRVLLRALDEGREASAPFMARAGCLLKEQWDRLAAFHEAVSEPEEKNDVR